MRWSRTATEPSTAPPWLPSAFDSVVVMTTSGAPAKPSSCSSPRPPAPRTPSTVRLVDDQQRPVPAADLVQVAQRGQRAVGGEHRLGDDDGPFLVARGQRRVDGVDVAVRGDHDAGPGQPACVDQRGVRQRVGHQQRARAGQADDRAKVGGVARGEHQTGCGADEFGKAGLQLLVQRTCCR